MTSRTSKLIFGVVAIATIVAAAVPSWRETVGSLGLLVGLLYAGPTYILRARRLPEARERRSWTLIGGAFTMSALGVVTVAVIGVARGALPRFSVADIIILSGYLLLMVAVAIMPGSPSGDWRERTSRSLDGLITAISFASLSAVLAFQDIVSGLGSLSTFERSVAIAYPVLDTAALVSIGIAFVRRRHHKLDLRLLLLSLGLVVQVVADLAYLRAVALVDFADVAPNLTWFSLATLFYTASASITDKQPEPREIEDRRTPLWSLIAPYGAASVMTVLFAVAVYNDDHRNLRFLYVTSSIVMTMVLTRQALAIRENRMLVDQERTALVSSLSHELRTPLTSLVGFLSVLDDDGDMLTAEERMDLIATTRQQAEFMGRMVTDLVMLARDDLDQTDIYRQVESMAAVVERAVLASHVPADKISVEVPSDLHAEVDADRMVQVIVNLLTNAHRYGGGGILVTAEHHRRELALAVHDDGEGVPKKYQLTMWDRFERGAHAYDALRPGSGIGLAIVSALVRAHGGRVDYRESERLGGACFVVRLPDAVPNEDGERTLSARIETAAQSPAV